MPGRLLRCWTVGIAARGTRRPSRAWPWAVAVAATAVLLDAGRVAAQTVAGRVVHEMIHSPVDSVEVVLIADSAGTHVDSTRTSATGNFHLHAPGGGIFRLEFRRDSGKRWTVPPFALGPGDTHERQFAMPVEFFLGYTESEVDRAALILDRGAAPVYPARLRHESIAGDCLVQFAVDARGRADMSTFEVLRGSHVLFCDAAHDALSGMTFLPAQIRGATVRQVMQLPFTFGVPR